MHVASELEDGLIKRAFPKGYLVKEDDFRRAFVTLPRGTNFTFPELEAPEVKTKEKQDRENYMKALNESFKMHTIQQKGRRGLPTWFSI